MNEQRVYSQYIDASNYQYVSRTQSLPAQFEIRAAGVCPNALTLRRGGEPVANLTTDGVTVFDWPGLEALASDPAAEGTAVAIARMLLAAKATQPEPTS